MKTAIQDQKQALRSAMTARRAELPPAERSRLSLRIQERILALPAFAAARTVLLYSPVRGEADTSLLLEHLWRRGARVLLPRCRPERPGEMDLFCVAGLAELKPGAWGIPEPDPAACDLFEGCAIDLAVVPGVAFDRAGARLGLGGGYYDRLLAQPDMAACLKIAPAYGFQVVERLPREAWDRPMDIILTESETLEIKGTP